MTNIYPFDEILTELQNIKKRKDIDAHSTRRAIRALHYAVKESSYYYDQVIKNDRQDQDVETQLKLYWEAATLSMRMIHNERMFKICSDPSMILVNTSDWRPENKRGFTLDFSTLIRALSHAVGVSNRKS